MNQRISHTKVLDMSNRNLKNFDFGMITQIFDFGLNTSTEEVILSHNNLRTTDGFTPLKQLIKLDLSFNKIHLFFQLPHTIQILNLSNNQLGEVFQGYAQTLKSKGTRQEVKPMFSNLFHLREINLSFNEISAMNSSVFESNVQLRVVNLSNNLLQGHIYYFKKQPNLTTLDLSNNKYESIQEFKGLDKMPSLTLLLVGGNPAFHNDDARQKLINLLQMVKEINFMSDRTKSPFKDCSNDFMKKPCTPRNLNDFLQGNIENFHSQPSQRPSHSSRTSLQHVPSKTHLLCQPSKTQRDQSPITPTHPFKPQVGKKTHNTHKSEVETQSTEKLQTEKLPDVPVKEFHLDPDKNILLESSIKLSNILNPEDRTPDTKSIFLQGLLNQEERLLNNEEHDDQRKQYSEAHQKTQYLNSIIKQRKQKLSALERENNQQKQYVCILKDVLRFIYLFEDDQPSHIQQVSDELDQIHEDLKIGKIQTPEQSEKYMKDKMVKLLSFNSKNDSIAEVLQKISNTERLKTLNQ